MNKYMRALVVYPTGVIKMGLNRLFHMRGFRAPLICQISPNTELTIDRGASVRIGSNFKMRSGSVLRVRNGAECVLGNNVAFNGNNMLACQNRITIGNNVRIGWNSQLYDHDHDYSFGGDGSANHYKTAPIEIGNNVWILSNCVIVRGTRIGDNTVIGAGTVVSGDIPADSIVFQNRQLCVRPRKVTE